MLEKFIFLSLQTSHCGSVGMTAPPQHITRVTATATVKVEVHTPLPGSCKSQTDILVTS